MSWQDFEHKVGEFFRNKGYQVERGSRISGFSKQKWEIDIIARDPIDGSIIWACQCKRWKKPVGRSIVAEWVTTCKDIDAKPAIASYMGFSREAISFARSRNVYLIDREALNMPVEAVTFKTTQEWQKELQSLSEEKRLIKVIESLHRTNILQMTEEALGTNPDTLKFEDPEMYDMFYDSQIMTKFLKTLNLRKNTYGYMYYLGQPSFRIFPVPIQGKLEIPDISETIKIIFKILRRVTGHIDFEPYPLGIAEKAKMFLECWEEIAKSNLNPFNYYEAYISTFGHSEDYTPSRVDFFGSRSYVTRRSDLEYDSQKKVIIAKPESKDAYLKRLRAEKAVWLQIIKYVREEKLEVLEKIFNTNFHILEEENTYPAVSSRDDIIQLFSKAKGIEANINEKSTTLNKYLSNLSFKS